MEFDSLGEAIASHINLSNGEKPNGKEVLFMKSETNGNGHTILSMEDIQAMYVVVEQNDHAVENGTFRRLDDPGDPYGAPTTGLEVLGGPWYLNGGTLNRQGDWGDPYGAPTTVPVTHWPKMGPFAEGGNGIVNGKAFAPQGELRFDGKR